MQVYALRAVRDGIPTHSERRQRSEVAGGENSAFLLGDNEATGGRKRLEIVKI